MSEKKNLQGVKEIAKLANVSIGTVDRVLHNRPGVAKATKERVLAILNEHNYSPNLIGRALSKRKLITLAVMVPKSSEESAFWDAPLKGIQRAVSELEIYQVKLELFLYDQNDRLSFIEKFEELKKAKVDGLVLAPTFLKESKQVCLYCDEENIPYNFINSNLEGCNNLAYYGPDLFQSGTLAAWLISLLNKPNEEFLIVHVSKELEEDHHILIKEEGVRSFFKKHNIEQKMKHLIILGTDYSYVSNKLETYLKSSNPKSILVSNSRVSTIARFFEEKQISGIRLIGFDFLPENVEYLQKSTIDFLICHKPLEQGYQSIMSLFAQVNTQKTPPKINYSPLDVICKENYQYYQN